MAWASQVLLAGEAAKHVGGDLIVGDPLLDGGGVALGPLAKHAVEEPALLVWV